MKTCVRLAAILGVATIFSGCAHFGPSSNPSTTAEAAPPKIFHDYDYGWNGSVGPYARPALSSSR